MNAIERFAAIAAIAAGLAPAAQAAYTIPKFRVNQYYDSNAVLQRGVTLPICGTADWGKTITVTFPVADDFGQLGFTVPSDNFTIINKPSNFDVKVLTNEIVVNVVGYSYYIQEMTPADIYATVNLLGMELAQGAKSVTVTFRLSGANAKAWVAGEEYKVELLITDAEEDIEETESV